MSQSKLSGAEKETAHTHSQSTTSTVTILQSICMGSVAGATEVAVDHPLWSIKTRLQMGQPFTFNPRLLYCGIGPNMASMIPITALQVGLNEGIRNIVFNTDQEMSPWQRITCAFSAGIGSAFVSGPTEMVMTHQNQLKKNFSATAKYIVQNFRWSALWCALPATAMREGIFTVGVLAATPIAKAQIKSYCENETIATLLAGMSAGVGATLASQGIDTVKTIQQSSRLSQPINVLQAVAKIHDAYGLYGFFRGAIPRGTRVMSAVTIMGAVNEQMQKHFAKV